MGTSAAVLRSHFISAWLRRFSFGASVLWIPVANDDQQRNFDAELLFYETDLVLGRNPQVIR
jgi:hypothetical protein